MGRPLLLDLFCGGGGAAAGYAAAGFEVIGVDIDRQPNYPFPFIRADAIAFLNGVFDDVQHGYTQWAAIHASPPCQPYSRGVTSRSSKWNDTKGRDEPQLIEPVRELLVAINRPWVIENVPGAPLNGITLCGSMFGLDIPRHRIFETSRPLVAPPHPRCRGIAKTAAERRGWEYRDMSVTGKGRHAGTSDRWAELLGIDWPMRQHDLKEAIPPAYTNWVGNELMDMIQRSQLVGYDLAERALA